MMVVDDKYPIGSVVYLSTDPEQHQRLVTGIMIRSGSYVQYELSIGDQVPCMAVEIEITKEKNFSL